MTVLAKGVMESLAPTTNCRPEGFELKFSVTVLGSRKTLLLSVKPHASVTVSLISMYE